jgi:hypothetical protein
VNDFRIDASKTRAKELEIEAALRDKLARIGPGWALVAGPSSPEGKLLRAERAGTTTFSQASHFADGLLEAVIEAELRIGQQVVPTHTGVKSA